MYIFIAKCHHYSLDERDWISKNPKSTSEIYLCIKEQSKPVIYKQKVVCENELIRFKRQMQPLVDT